MDIRNEMDHDEMEQEETGLDELDRLAEVFRVQLKACLEECAQERKGLFLDLEENTGGEEGWPEAARLRELAMALQGVFAQAERRCALCEEFLDLCTIHGESNPGERRLARALLERIEKGEVGTPTQEERKPWS
jgi:hypothetical protein